MNYFRAPITKEEIHNRFNFADGAPLSDEEEAELADSINQAVEYSGAAFWANPETDTRKAGAKIYGRPLKVGDRAVRYVLRSEEWAVFPARKDDGIY